MQKKASMENEKGQEKQKVATCAMHLHNANWNHTKVMASINYKKKEHIVLKYIINPKAKMVFAKDRWSKIAKDLQQTTKSKSPHNSKICKDLCQQRLQKDF